MFSQSSWFTRSARRTALVAATLGVVVAGGAVAAAPAMASSSITVGTLSLDKSTVDMTGGTVYVVGTVHITDTAGPLTFADADLLDPNGAVWSGFQVTLASGTQQDGVFQFHFDIDKWDPVGTWTVQDLQLADATGPVTVPESATFSVTGPVDKTLPILDDVSFDKTAVDTRMGDGQVQITAHAHDASAPSGETVSGVTGLFVKFVTPGSETQEVHLVHQSGTAWSGPLLLPQSTSDGIWEVLDVEVWDEAHNGNGYSGTGLAPYSLPDSVLVSSQAPPDAVTGLSPTPGVHSMSLAWTAAPRAQRYTVDVSPGGQHLTSDTPGATVTGLPASSTYTFTVHAVSGSGSSPATQVTGKPDPAPGPQISKSSGPDGVTVSSRTASFNWFVTTDPYLSIANETCKLDSATPQPCNGFFMTSGSLGDGAHTFLAKVTDTDGSTATATWSWTVDGTAPTMALPSSPHDSLSTSIPVKWHGSDASGVSSYDVRYQQSPATAMFADWVTWLSKTASTSATFKGGPGHEYCFSVRAHDTLGNTSKWTKPSCTSLPVDDRALKASSGWKSGTGSAYYRGTILTTKVKGATLTRSHVWPGGVALLVTKAPGAGSVSIAYGSKVVKTVSLNASTKHNKVLISLPNYSREDGSIVIRTTSAKPVSIDGLLLSPNWSSVQIV